MNRSEARHQLISAFLQADGPLPFPELLARSALPEEELPSLLQGLLDEGLVTEGRLLPEGAAPQYCWAARWEKEARRRAEAQKRRLEAIVGPLIPQDEGAADLDSKSALAFCRFVIDDYQPPAEKRFLVFLQCSVRRPFSSSPSHASMRRAISVATGYDPGLDFHSCPVHVVVLASKLGPVPYELEDVYPANVRGGGVKQFSRDHYARVRPVLASRMAGYLIAHRGHYERMAAFTDGRYGEVMEDVRRTGAGDFPILPDDAGPAVTRMGASTPRKYWEKYWIQLYLHVVSWLSPALRSRAEARLQEMAVAYR